MVLLTGALAILADVGNLLRAIRSRVTFLLTNVASSLEDTRLGALRLGVA